MPPRSSIYSFIVYALRTDFHFLYLIFSCLTQLAVNVQAINVLEFFFVCLPSNLEVMVHTSIMNEPYLELLAFSHALRQLKDDVCLLKLSLMELFLTFFAFFWFSPCYYRVSRVRKLNS